MTVSRSLRLDDCIVLVDKPAGKTSFAVVRDVRRLSRVRKVGHCGSLDPQATGLLLLCTGLATRLAGVFVDQPKEYEARIRIVGRNDQTWGELVTPPTGPGNPTDGWERDDIFKGQYRVPVERSAGNGEARLVVELRERGGTEVVGRAEIGKVTVKGR